MSEITGDIMRAAQSAFDDGALTSRLNKYDYDCVLAAIAKAILAERERVTLAVDGLQAWETSESGTMYHASAPFGNGEYIDKYEAMCAICAPKGGA
jgi:hypothetical protein